MERQGQSRMGILSLALAIISAVCLFLLTLVAGVLEAASQPAGLDENSPVAVVLGLCLLGFMGLDLVAIALGIAGIIQRTRHRLLAMIGIIIAMATEIIMASLIAVGLIIGA